MKRKSIENIYPVTPEKPKKEVKNKLPVESPVNEIPTDSKLEDTGPLPSVEEPIKPESPASKEHAKNSFPKAIGAVFAWILNFILRILTIIVNSILSLLDSLQWLIVSAIVSVALYFIFKTTNTTPAQAWEMLTELIKKLIQK